MENDVGFWIFMLFIGLPTVLILGSIILRVTIDTLKEIWF